MEQKRSVIDSAQKVREETLSVIKKSSIEQLNKKVSSHNEAWTILEVTKHLYVSEDGMVKLMQLIKNHTDPNTLPGVPEDFDRDRYNKRQVQKLEELSKEDILTKLAESRQNFVKFVNNLSEEDFAKKGRPASLNIYTIADIINIIPTHEQEHLQKIKSILGP